MSRSLPILWLVVAACACRSDGARDDAGVEDTVPDAADDRGTFPDAFDSVDDDVDAADGEVETDAPDDEASEAIPDEYRWTPDRYCGITDTDRPAFMAPPSLPTWVRHLPPLEIV